jgi:transcriptional regulator with XRE-family HTH domain
MADRTEDRTGENLRRLMAGLGLTTEQVAARSEVDKRTIHGILDGSKTPQLRTIGRLAKGLGVSSDEFFFEPAQLLYRHFDRATNPVIDEAVESHPEIFADWTVVEFDELQSRFGTGGSLTPEGALIAAREMNGKRQLHEKLAVLLESSQSEVAAEIVEVLYQKAVKEKE